MHLPSSQHTLDHQNPVPLPLLLKVSADLQLLRLTQRRASSNIKLLEVYIRVLELLSAITLFKVNLIAEEADTNQCGAIEVAKNSIGIEGHSLQINQNQNILYQVVSLGC
jgi:hypothetical protein